MKIKQTITTIIAMSMAMTSCDKAETPAVTQTNDNTSVVMEQRFTTATPNESVSIAEARLVPAGEKVTVKGTLLGREKIFVDQAAIFIIGDPEKIEIEEDEEQPWTACCTPPDIVKNNTLTVQFLDSNGQLIMNTAKGVKGLKELDQVVISGTMDSTSTPEAPLLNIDTISFVK